MKIKRSSIIGKGVLYAICALLCGILPFWGRSLVMEFGYRYGIWPWLEGYLSVPSRFLEILRRPLFILLAANLVLCIITAVTMAWKKTIARYTLRLSFFASINIFVILFAEIINCGLNTLYVPGIIKSGGSPLWQGILAYSIQLLLCCVFYWLFSFLLYRSLGAYPQPAASLRMEPSSSNEKDTDKSLVQNGAKKAREISFVRRIALFSAFTLVGAVSVFCLGGYTYLGWMSYGRGYLDTKRFFDVIYYPLIFLTGVCFAGCAVATIALTWKKRIVKIALAVAIGSAALVFLMAFIEYAAILINNRVSLEMLSMLVVIGYGLILIVCCCVCLYCGLSAHFSLKMKSTVSKLGKGGD